MLATDDRRSAARLSRPEAAHKHDLGRGEAPRGENPKRLAFTIAPRSTARFSPWVRWEIQEGTKMAGERRIPFVPVSWASDSRLSIHRRLRPAGRLWPHFKWGGPNPALHKADFTPSG